VPYRRQPIWQTVADHERAIARWETLVREHEQRMRLGEIGPGEFADRRRTADSWLAWHYAERSRLSHGAPREEAI
jgi:hypothetical protein